MEIRSYFRPLRTEIKFIQQPIVQTPSLLSSFVDEACAQTDGHDIFFSRSFVRIVRRTHTRVFAHCLQIRGQNFIYCVLDFWYKLLQEKTVKVTS
jgi:hypothetical protein